MAAHVAQDRFVEAGGFEQLHRAPLIVEPFAMGEWQIEEPFLVVG